MKNITAQQLADLKATHPGLLVVNTLPADKFDATKIEGAINVPQAYDDFPKRIENIADGKHKPVVVYCASADCDSSAQGAQKLDAVGFEEVYEFTDGAEGWKQYQANK